MQGISPSIQMRYEEIERRNRPVPIQFRDMAQSALAGAQTVEQIQADKEKKRKAAEFQAVLEKGVPAMREFQAGLPETSPARRVDPELFKDQPHVWWQMALEDQGRAQVGQHLAAGNLDQAEASASAYGLTKDPAATIAARRETAAKDKTTREKAEREAALQGSFAKWREDITADLEAANYSLDDAALNRITNSFPNDLAGYEPAEKFRDNLVKKAQPSPFAQGNQDLRTQGQIFQQENTLRDEFDKKTESFRTAFTAYKKLHQAIERNNPADAYSAIINYVRTLDPNSTVREAEERLARERSAGGPLGALGQHLQNLKDGKLTDPIRKNLLEAGRGLVGAEYDSYKSLRSDYQGRVKGYQGRGFTIDEGAVLGKDFGPELDSLLTADIFKKAPARSPGPAAKPKPATKPKNDPLGLF